MKIGDDLIQTLRDDRPIRISERMAWFLIAFASIAFWAFAGTAVGILLR